MGNQKPLNLLFHVLRGQTQLDRLRIKSAYMYVFSPVLEVWRISRAIQIAHDIILYRSVLYDLIENTFLPIREEVDKNRYSVFF